MPAIDIVWDRIEAHAGETFSLVRGDTFTHRVAGAHVVPDRSRLAGEAIRQKCRWDQEA